MLAKREDYKLLIIGIIVSWISVPIAYACTNEIKSTNWPPSLLPELTLTNNDFRSDFYVTTESEQAKKYFYYGLEALHAFAYLEAYRSFVKALRIDPNFIMANWGLAYTYLGKGDTGEALDKLIMKTKSGLEFVSPIERMYIYALIAYTRSKDDYKQALEALIEAHPNEIQAKLLLTHFLNHGYKSNGAPIDGQAYAKAILEPLLSVMPNSMAVNHYWLHAIEGSEFPQKAQLSADKLQLMNSEFGHIRHMPGHIDWRLGKYEDAISSFKAAEVLDMQYMQELDISPSQYWSYLHNTKYLFVAELEIGDIEAAKRTVERVAEAYETNTNIVYSAAEMASFKVNYASRLYTRTGQWQKAYELIIENASDDIQHQIILLHSAVLSVLNNGDKDVDIERTKEQLSRLKKLVNNSHGKHYHDNEQVLLAEAEAVVLAIELHFPEAIASFKKALQLEQKIVYQEPPVRMRSVYETAGQVFCYLKHFDIGKELIQEAINANSNNFFAKKQLQQCG